MFGFSAKYMIHWTYTINEEQNNKKKEKMYVEKNTSHKENFLGSYHNHATVLPLTKKGEKTLKYIVLPAFSDKRIK